MKNDFWEKDMRLTRKKIKQNGGKVKSVAESRLALKEYLTNKQRKITTSEAKVKGGINDK